MRKTSLILTAVAALAATSPFSPVLAQDNGLKTLSSAHSHQATLEKYEAVVRAMGMRVFTRIDHAAAAKDAGLSMPPATVIVFGAPKTGTPNFLKAPTLAIDLPLKALVWQDKDGKTFVTYNAASYVLGPVFGRHGLKPPEPAVKAQEEMLASIADAATK